MTAKASYGGARELVLKRIIGAPREALFRAWTEADLLKQWFAPKPWAIVEARLDIRTGGSNRFVMKSPEGKEFPNCGVSLAVVPNEKTVLANVYVEARVLSEKSFFTASSAFEDIGGSEAKCVARARRWTTEDRKTHEKRGFHEG
ncbi:MAG: SRPBCC family protein [Amphiplicatus sp.]